MTVKNWRDKRLLYQMYGDQSYRFNMHQSETRTFAPIKCVEKDASDIDSGNINIRKIQAYLVSSRLLNDQGEGGNCENF